MFKRGRYTGINMKALFFAWLLFFIGCQANITPGELQKQLKETMTDYLYKSVNNDSSKVKYQVLDVIYYDDKVNYNCEFKVQMKALKLDTIGTMKAFISRDFKTVKRIY